MPNIVEPNLLLCDVIDYLALRVGDVMNITMRLFAHRFFNQDKGVSDGERIACVNAVVCKRDE